jgi:hypothetical protein
MCACRQRRRCSHICHSSSEDSVEQPAGTTLGSVTNIRQLEVLSEAVLRSELRLRQQDDQGSKVKLVSTAYVIYTYSHIAAAICELMLLQSDQLQRADSTTRCLSTSEVVRSSTYAHYRVLT